MLPHVFRWLKIAPLRDKAIALTLATVGLYLKERRLWSTSAACSLESRQERLLLEAWQPWLQIVSVGDLCKAVGNFFSFK